MYNQPEVALEQYELEVKKVIRGRGAYICQTNQGMKMLVPFKGSNERADTIRQVLIYIKENGMAVEQINQTKEGQVISYDDAETKYLLKDYYKGSECNPRELEDIYEAAAVLGKLHDITGKCQVVPPEFMVQSTNKLLDDCKKHNRELTKIKNFIRNRKQKNEFEMLFWNHYKHFLEHALISTECQDSMIICQKNIWCHGDYNYHNILIGEEGILPVNFEMMSMNMAISDLANYMRKILEKNQWSLTVGNTILEGYTKHCKLTDDEIRHLGYILLYPEKFWKIANHYYNGHKAWVSERDIEKLSKVIEQENERVAFLQNMFSFTI